MKFLLWLGMWAAAEIVIWMTFFGIYFIADDMTHHQAALGVETGTGGEMLIPVLLSVFAGVLSGIIAATWRKTA